MNPARRQQLADELLTHQWAIYLDGTNKVIPCRDLATVRRIVSDVHSSNALLPAACRLEPVALCYGIEWPL